MKERSGGFSESAQATQNSAASKSAHYPQTTSYGGTSMKEGSGGFSASAQEIQESAASMSTLASAMQAGDFLNYSKTKFEFSLKSSFFFQTTQGENW
jgi:hypothetical protein